MAADSTECQASTGAFVIALRPPISLTEEQESIARNYDDCKNAHDYVDVLATTIVIHKEEANRTFGINSCFFLVLRSGNSRPRAFLAPKFCCRPPVERWRHCPLYNSYVNMEKADLRVLTTTADRPELPEDAADRCSKCGASYAESCEFGLPCGHLVLCRACWLAHCEESLDRDEWPTPCIEPDCRKQLTLSRAATLLDDASLGRLRDLQWAQQLRRPDLLQCAGCSGWLEPDNFYRTVLSMGCACGCFTCGRCKQREHAPLICEDALLWRKAKETEHGHELYFRDPSQFKQCLAYGEAIASESYKENLRFMKQQDRLHTKLLAEAMPMVAQMLEMRLVQQLGDRPSLPPGEDDYYSCMDADELWQQLEKWFGKSLDRLGSTKEKTKELLECRDRVLYHYAFGALRPDPAAV